MTAAVLVGRVGGLAAALGAGAFLGLGLVSVASAAPASAAPADSSSRAGDSADVSSSPRRAPAAVSAGRGLTAVSARNATPNSVGRSAPRPAAVISRVSDRPTAASPVAAIPAVIAPVATHPAAAIPVVGTPKAAAVSASTLSVSPAPVARAVVAPTTWRETRRAITAPSTPAVQSALTATAVTAPAERPPGPIARMLQALFGCDPRGRLITIYKGTHFAIPNNFGGFFVENVSGTGTFTSDSVYDLKDEDQHDWSKFTGIAFTPFEPDRNSAMVGWRYDLDTQEFEIAPFYNVDKVRILPKDPAEVISIPAGETFQYSVDYTGVTLSYGGKTVFKPYPEGLTPNRWTAVRVSGWFGGNEVAPRTLSYFISFA